MEVSPLVTASQAEKDLKYKRNVNYCGHFTQVFQVYYLIILNHISTVFLCISVYFCFI